MRPKVGRRGTRVDDRHAEWRARRLRSAGFEPSTAELIARESAFDVHALLELVDRGCPPALAVRIVAPLEWEGLP
jgi:hypothetical protein